MLDIVTYVMAKNAALESSQQAYSTASYSALVTEFNSAAKDTYKVGQSIYVKTASVPDLWIYSVESTSVSYTYTTDTAFLQAMAANEGVLQIGYYKVAQLETAKPYTVTIM